MTTWRKISKRKEMKVRKNILVVIWWTVIFFKMLNEMAKTQLVCKACHITSTPMTERKEL